MWIRYFLLWGLVILLFSCTALEKPKVEEITPGAPQPIAKEAWQIKWDNWLGAARKEGRLMIIGSIGGIARDALIRGFREKYGIDLDIVTGRGEEQAQKVLSEKRAGLHLVDLFIGGPETMMLHYKANNLLIPLEPILLLPEVLDPKVWWKGALDWVDKDHMMLASMAHASYPLGLNTRYVKPEDIKSYRDLLHPKWKGKFVMNDPTIAGTGQNWIGIIGDKVMGMDFVREFVKQEPVIIRNQRLIVEWLAQGKYPIAIQPNSDQLAEFLNAGAPLLPYAAVEGGGTLSSGGTSISMFKDAPHPNAARVFANWLITKEGQTIFSQASGGQSGRLDVSTEHLPPNRIRVPGRKYFTTYLEDDMLERPKYRKIAEEIYGHLMR